MSIAQTLRINRRRGEVALDLPEYMKEYRVSESSVDPVLLSQFRSMQCSGGETRVILGRNVNAKGANVSVKGSDNNIIIGSDTIIRGKITIVGSYINIIICAHTTFNNVEILCRGVKHGVYIGRDCMFSTHIEIRTSDSHSLIDLDTMRRTNPPDGVYIGDHVWVSKHAAIMKGAAIGDDNVVGYGALVNGNMDMSNAMLVGAPAKPIPGRRVTWSRLSNVKKADDTVFEWKNYPQL